MRLRTTVVPTIGFSLLYAFVIVRLDRRDLVWTNVTTKKFAVFLRCVYRKPSDDVFSAPPNAIRRLTTAYDMVNALAPDRHQVVLDMVEKGLNCQ
jgi:hypothetical protein